MPAASARTSPAPGPAPASLAHFVIFNPTLALRKRDAGAASGAGAGAGVGASAATGGVKAGGDGVGDAVSSTEDTSVTGARPSAEHTDANVAKEAEDADAVPPAYNDTASPAAPPAPTPAPPPKPPHQPVADPGLRNRDLEEDIRDASQIVFYTSREAGGVSRNTMLRQVGLAKGLMGFADMATGPTESTDEPNFWAVHSHQQRMVVYSPEPDWFIYICVKLAHDGTGEGTSQGVSDRMLVDGLKRGYEDFCLLHLSLGSQLPPTPALSSLLERYWTRFALSFETTYLVSPPSLTTWIGGHPPEPDTPRLTSALNEFASTLPVGSGAGLLSPSQPLAHIGDVHTSGSSSGALYRLLNTHLTASLPPDPPPDKVDKDKGDRQTLGFGFGRRKHGRTESASSARSLNHPPNTPSHVRSGSQGLAAPTPESRKSSWAPFSSPLAWVGLGTSAPVSRNVTPAPKPAPKPAPPKPVPKIATPTPAAPVAVPRVTAVASAEASAAATPESSSGSHKSRWSLGLGLGQVGAALGLGGNKESGDKEESGEHKGEESDKEAKETKEAAATENVPNENASKEDESKEDKQDDGKEDAGTSKEEASDNDKSQQTTEEVTGQASDENAPSSGDEGFDASKDARADSGKPAEQASPDKNESDPATPQAAGKEQPPAAPSPAPSEPSPPAEPADASPVATSPPSPSSTADSTAPTILQPVALPELAAAVEGRVDLTWAGRLVWIGGVERRVVWVIRDKLLLFVLLPDTREWLPANEATLALFAAVHKAVADEVAAGIGDKDKDERDDKNDKDNERDKERDHKERERERERKVKPADGAASPRPRGRDDATLYACADVLERQGRVDARDGGVLVELRDVLADHLGVGEVYAQAPSGRFAVAKLARGGGGGEEKQASGLVQVGHGELFVLTAKDASLTDAEKAVRAYAYARPEFTS